jgi:ssDNA-binding Zn-finger/Zn-ribbon topoisomerase 1
MNPSNTTNAPEVEASGSETDAQPATGGGQQQRPHLVADCPDCDGQLVEEHRTWPHERVHVGLICHDCDTSARVEWPQGDQPQQEDVTEGTAPGLRVASVAWIDCPHCRGRGTVEEVGISTERVGCPRCYRTGSVPRVVETDGGTVAQPIADSADAALTGDEHRRLARVIAFLESRGDDR